MKTKLKFYALAFASSFITFTACQGWNYYVTLPQAREQWERQAIASNAGEYDRHTREFKFIAEVDLFLDPPLPRK